VVITILNFAVFAWTGFSQSPLSRRKVRKEKRLNADCYDGYDLL